MREVFSVIVESFQYTFVIQALIVGIFIAVSTSFLGVFLVLKKFSLIGDGLAHVTFASVGLAFLFQQEPLLFSLPIVALASLLILKISSSETIYGDTAIGMVSTSALAFGVVLISVAQGFNADLFSYLFGSILLVSSFEVILTIMLTLVIVLFLFYYYHDLIALTYDEEFATLNGVKSTYLNDLLAILTAIVIVLGIRILGTMLISALIIFPVASAMQVTSGFLKTIITTIIIAILAVVLGLLFSIGLNFPSGATIVLMNAIIFFGCYIQKRLRN